MAMIATALTTAANKITLGCSSVHRQTAGFAINTLMVSIQTMGLLLNVMTDFKGFLKAMPP